MIQDINSRVYLVQFISEKIVKLLTEYGISYCEMQKVFIMVEQEMENKKPLTNNKKYGNMKGVKECVQNDKTCQILTK